MNAYGSAVIITSCCMQYVVSCVCPVRGVSRRRGAPAKLLAYPAHMSSTLWEILKRSTIAR